MKKILKTFLLALILLSISQFAYAQECVDLPALNTAIAQWKTGSLPMPQLMQKIADWKAGTGCTANTCSSISQYDITWTFDQAYPCGQFVNGDWWVTPVANGAAVIITGVTPEYAAGRNGWEVNPSRIDKQGLDSRGGNISWGVHWYEFDPALVPTLPLAVSYNASILKAVSVDNPIGNTPGIQKAAVLTVLTSTPPNNGATVFRPPYFGTNKPLYSAVNLHTELPGNLEPTASTPSIGSLAVPINKVQIDYAFSPSGFSAFIYAVEHSASSGQSIGTALTESKTAQKLELIAEETAGMCAVQVDFRTVQTKNAIEIIFFKLF